MWFKAESSFFELEKIFVLCDSSNKGDNGADRRFRTLFKVLLDSANKYYWRDPIEMSRQLKRPLYSCQKVWQLCIDEGVFRPYEDGFNAYEWMVEKGLIGLDTKAENRTTSNRNQSTGDTRNDFFQVGLAGF